jgi:hypothetical protein
MSRPIFLKKHYRIREFSKKAARIVYIPTQAGRSIGCFAQEK